MIKVEHQIGPEPGVVKFAFQASSMEDYPQLDLLREALSDSAKVRVGFIDGKRLIAHFKDVPSLMSTPDSP